MRISLILAVLIGLLCLGLDVFAFIRIPRLRKPRKFITHGLIALFVLAGIISIIISIIAGTLI